jgi:hypothetical protein
MRFRAELRLIGGRSCATLRSLIPKRNGSRRAVATAIHRFEQSIAGRDYLIEVRAVAQDRWRAYIVRIPGVPTAMMPFYGRTPDEAARQLSAWLTRAYARADS